MAEDRRWEKCRISCPEQGAEAELFLEWRRQEGKEALYSSSCKNPKLLDLSGTDCQWTCWDILEKKVRET